MAGSYAYDCHVHTVKHLEMGMYGVLIVRTKNAAGAWLNQLTHNTATASNYVQNYLLSAVDPAYHTATGDSAVFADYNPRYFLIQGNEGRTTSLPAISLSTARNSKVALRLIEDREDCLRRMRGEGTTSGSVESGGIYRELRTTMPAD